MSKPEAAGRMVQWAIELSQFDIEYHPKTAIKAQALADFITEFTLPDDGDATNNEAEYEGILTGLRLGNALGIKNLLIQSDSKLAIGQIREEYEAKEERMQKYLKLVRHLARGFDKLNFVRIPRNQNAEADEVAKMASSIEEPTDKEILMEIQKYPSIEEVPIFPIHNIGGWMAPIVSYLQDGHLPHDSMEARKIKARAARFTILNDTLYKRGFSSPYLKCIDEEEAKYVLHKIHEGICGDHAGPRSLVSKVIRAGYFWPTMQADAIELVKRFGIPQTIISDNGRQFDSQGFRDFCSGLGIKNKFSSPGHPQSNGQTEVTNRTLLRIIKARLDEAKGAWPEELPHVLWAYRTTARTPTGETPFRLTYGTEAVIPVEVGIASTRREVFREENNDDQLRINLDCLDEVRDKASNMTMKYQQKMTEYYNKRVRLRRLEIGNLVLRKVTTATRDSAHGKLGPTWEGPYKVVHYSRQGSYHLETLDGQKLPRPWNIENLKKYHQQR
ncbi:uncharacterized protein LOC142632865 [Castanea sativa]|uniref:uncharacterized protein LOC142632865 n=1 Tax=Castanea sativa TaxID=21020 RepID=UPI003F64A996